MAEKVQFDALFGKVRFKQLAIQGAGGRSKVAALVSDVEAKPKCCCPGTDHLPLEYKIFLCPGDLVFTAGWYANINKAFADATLGAAAATEAAPVYFLITPGGGELTYGCFYITGELWDGVETKPNGFPPGTVGGGATYHFETDCACDDIDRPPWRPPPPLPPPDDTPPADCGECANPPGTFADCTYCDCTPAYGIRVTISGLTNCPTCIASCGIGPAYESSVLRGDVNLNGVYDLFRVGLGECDWSTTTTVTIVHGPPGGPDCTIESTTTVTLHLRKISSTLWVFSMYVNDMYSADPRDFNPDNDDANWRFFTGSHSVSEGQCMTVGSMTNQITCGCRSTGSNDGRFDLASGGTASFTILCA